MAKLPPLSGRQVVKALSKAGFEVVGRKGSHVRLKKKTPTKT
jgi:predicted RNA binding protein YcfA (HicA-like mRNA interferase family)